MILRAFLFAGGAALGLVAALPAAAKTLVYCSEGSPENFNPQINTTGTTFDATHPVYSQLIAFKPGSTDLIPNLAEKWDISDDAKTYIFHLRHGVKWQSNAQFKPTRDFSADDVLFSFGRMADANAPFHKVSRGSYSYWGDMSLNKLVKSIDKVDDYTVKLTLSEPNAPFLADMAMEFASILSAEYGDTMMKAGKPEQIDQVPIGTGPFEFVAYQRDATIRYRRFDGYFGEKARLDALVFSITKDPAIRLAKLRANECQIAVYPAPADLAGIRLDQNLKLDSLPGLNIGYLAFNTQKKPFDDARVRRALVMAIDQEAILKAVYLGAGTPAKNLIPPTMWAYDDATPPEKYDPDAAKQLLATAGLPNGFETELWAIPVQRPYNPDGRRIAELMQSDLAKVGVTAKIVSYEWGEYRKRAQAGEGPMVQLGWTGDNGDPDNFFVPLAGCAAARPGGGNISKWCNKDFDDAVDEAAGVTDQAKRKQLYFKAQQIMAQEEPFFLIAHSVTFMPMRSNVTGFRISPLGIHSFETVEIK